MRKKQYLVLSLLSFLLLGGASFAPAQAQTKESTKAAPARQAKVKILKQEGATFYVLDTTLTLAHGMTFEEAAKKLQANGESLKSLGARAIKPLELSAAKGLEAIGYLPSQSLDSLKVMVFNRAASDTAFTSVKGVSVIRAHPLGDSVRGMKARTIHIYGNRGMIHGTIKLDSLAKHQRFFRVDSALQLSADTFSMQETIRVAKDSTTGEVKVTRLRKGRAPEVLETGDYNVIRLRSADQSQVLVLKATKGPAQAETLNTKKKSKKKEATAPLDLRFSPNPTNGEVNLAFFSEKKAKAEIRVVDSQGKTVYQEDLGTVQGQFTKNLNLNTYGRGMYLVQVQVGKSIQSGKVVVQ
ncbi:T9SS type A sorting domain-containing protein [Rufibacter sp. XAAS-G3-1]|uniref:T9SS type A sorting domain-containing protein n=1 Tax=Rufibacter sp. XAAS-G3-1 TaxID=2729134 RepID=UPI0015E695F2|nr:T9SS type A sorting domain-containing protein [Rufibacter sp. XAAS-G3-1]